MSHTSFSLISRSFIYVISAHETRVGTIQPRRMNLSPTMESGRCSFPMMPCQITSVAEYSRCRLINKSIMRHNIIDLPSDRLEIQESCAEQAQYNSHFNLLAEAL